MATIKTSKLKEVFTSKGVSESFIDDFFRNIKKRKKEKEFEKLSKDPQYQAILKRYNIEPIPWDKDFTLSDLPAFRKK
mgnify:FL=1|jgi:hypothetical protein